MALSGPKEQESRQDPGESAIAILKGMNFQEDDHKHPNGDDGMQILQRLSLGDPRQQSLHFPGCVKRSRCLSDDPNHVSPGIKGSDVVGKSFVAAPMPNIFFAELQENTMELENMILRGAEQISRIENQVHRGGITGHLLFVPRRKRLGLQAVQNRRHLLVGQLGAFNPCGKADTLDGGNPPQPREDLWRKPGQRLPTAFELVDPREDLEELGGKLQVGVVNHGEHPFVYPILSISSRCVIH